MLTGNLVRVRVARNRVIPQWLDVAKPEWIAAAEQLLDIFRTQGGRSRSEIDDEIEAAFGALQDQLVYRGLAKLLEDRCDFEIEAGLPPEQIRDAVFRAAAAIRQAAG